MVSKYKIYVTWIPIYNDEIEGGLKFLKPKFGYTNYTDKPCSTNWYYDWILSLGYISIYKKSEYKLAQEAKA